MGDINTNFKATGKAMLSLIKQFSLILALAGLALSPLVGVSAPQTPSVATTKIFKVKSAKKTKKNYRKVKVRLRKSSRYKKKRAIKVDPYDGTTPLNLHSAKALVLNQNTNEIIFAKNTNTLTSIASVTKLMTAMVILDSGVDLGERVAVTEQDVDYLKGTSSRIKLGTQLTRNELLRLALIASENRAASALASTFPGGRGKFIRAMNLKAISLGMTHTHYSDSTGLDPNNMSTAEDLARLVSAAYRYNTISNITTTNEYRIYLPGYDLPLIYKNTNALVREGEWDIGISKTGFINEAGRCLVMQAKVKGEPVVIVLLDSNGKRARITDAQRVRKWLEHNNSFRGRDNSLAPVNVGQM